MTAQGKLFVNALVGGSKPFDHKQCSQHQQYPDRQGNKCILDKAGNNISNEGDHGSKDGIGKLRVYMIDMFALGSGTCHDCGIRNGRAVITANSAGHTGRDGNDHQLMIGICKHGNDNGNQDTEGSPGGSAGECQTASY